MSQNLDLDLLRSFIAVSENGGFHAAGEKVGRTQAAISQQIKRLEEILDKPLFVRTTRKVKLTPYGEALMTSARRMLALNDEALLRIRDAAVSGTLRLGAPESLTTTHLPGILAIFSRAHPNVTLDVTCGLTDELLDNYERGSFDVVIFKRGARTQEQGTVIMTEQLSWMKGANSTFYESAEIPLILSPHPCEYRKRTIEILEKAKKDWRAIMTVHSLAGRVAAVKEGLGVSILPTAIVDEDLKILQHSRNLPNPGKIDLAFLSKDLNPETIAGQFSMYIRKYFLK